MTELTAANRNFLQNVSDKRANNSGLIPTREAFVACGGKGVHVSMASLYQPNLVPTLGLA